MSTWTDSQINAIKLRKDECKKKKNEHLKVSVLYDSCYKGTGLPQIILSSILSTTTLSQISEQESSFTLTVFLASCSVLLAILTSISHFFEFAKLKESHKKTGHSFGKLERLLEFELSRSEKQTYDSLFEHTLNEYNTIKENSHLIPYYFKNYVK